MNQFEDNNIINNVEIFLQKANLHTKLNGICALTIQVDKSSLSGTFIFDYNNRILLKHYPNRYSKTPIQPIYKTINGTPWTINFVSNLEPFIEKEYKLNAIESTECYPFCCNNCTKQYKTLPPKWELIFSNFKDRNGNSDYIFRVVKKIQYGKMLYLKYFKLTNGIITEIIPSETEHKINTFKIYTCNNHNTYYSIDLMSDEICYNYHHAKLQNETEFGPKLLKKMIE